jgi:Saxitoxin biosynthesis operon protein SxtJ
MLNPFKDTNWNPGTAEKRKFAISLIIGFPILAAVFALVGWSRTGAWSGGFVWLALIGTGLGALFWLLPQIARPFYLAWYFLACCLGIVMSNLLFAAFFYLVITPIGLFMRALGRDPLQKRLDRSRTTYWCDAENVVDGERYFRQF